MFLLYRKNVLTGVTRATFNFILENKSKYAVFFVIAITLFMVLEVALGESRLLSKTGSGNYSEFFNLAILTFLYSIATAVVAAPLHNQIICGSKSYLSVHVGRLLVFAVFEFCLSFAVGLGTLLLINSLVGDRGILAAATALYFGAAVLGVFFVTLMPHVAITRPKLYIF